MMGYQLIKNYRAGSGSLVNGCAVELRNQTQLGKISITVHSIYIEGHRVEIDKITLIIQ